MLSSLLQSVLSEDALSLSKLAIDFFELLSRLLNLSEKLMIVSLVLLVVITLFRV